MKTKLLLTLLILALSPVPCALSQIPQGFNYQAIVRNTSGLVIQSQPVMIKVEIQTSPTGGTVFWNEEHTITTTQFGLVSFVVGTGPNISGTIPQFKNINWSAQPLYLRTWVKYPVGGTYSELGTTQIWSVPYSLVAKDVDGPINKLDIKGTDASLDSALFEVKNINGQTIFAVYNEGVRVYVDNGAKGKKGGFAVGGFDMAKGTKQTFLAVSDDSVKIYIDSNPLTKKPKGGFAVGGYDMAKGIDDEYLRVTRDSTRVYVNENPGKGKKGGFAVGSFDASKGEDTITMFTDLTPENYFIGHRSGIKNLTGIHNSFVGYEAGMNNKSGRKNVFLGYHAGLNNDTASYNVFIGNEAGNSNTYGRYNTVIGYRAGYTNLTGANNVFLGYQAGFTNTSGSSNVLIGNQAGFYNTSNYNTFLGFQAGSNTTTATNNIYIGYKTGGGPTIRTNNTGSNNVMMGNLAGMSITSGSSNVIVGDQAGYTNSTGNYNLLLGYQAGYNNNANFNTFLGYQAGLSNATGEYNVFLGYQAGLNSTNSYNNTAIGYQAGISTVDNLGTKTQGSSNVFLGDQAGKNVTNGCRSVIIGMVAGLNWTGSGTTDGNVFIGYNAGSGTPQGATVGSAVGKYNTYIGTEAGARMLKGDLNVFIGDRAGVEARQGQHNVLIGGVVNYYRYVPYSRTDSINDNVYIGYGTGGVNWDGDRNTMIGSAAGAESKGSGNVFIGNKTGMNETGSNKLYIDNSSTTSPLIYGDFTDGSEKLVVNGKFGIGTGTAALTFPLELKGRGRVIASGESSGLWYTNLAGSTNIGFIGAYDDTRIGLYGYAYGWGLVMNVTNGYVGIGTATPGARLEVNSDPSATPALRIRDSGLNKKWDISADAGYNDAANADLFFQNNAGSNIAVFTNAGYVGLGTNAPSYKFQVNSSLADYVACINNTYGLNTSRGLKILSGSNAVTGSIFIGFHRPDNVSIGLITQNGTTTVNYGTTSDARVKENITDTRLSIADLMNIKVHDFNFIYDPNKQSCTGFIAQELVDIFPNAVSKPDNDKDLWTLDYGKITPLLVKAIQDQQQQIESTKLENQQLKSEMQALKEKMDRIEAMLAE